MFVDDYIADKKLSSPENLLNKPELIIKMIGSGNHNNHPSTEGRTTHKLSLEMKAFIGGLARVDGVKSVAKSFGLHPSIVSGYKNGKLKHDNGTTPNQELKDKIEDKVVDIRSKVLETISNAVLGITEEKTSKLSVVSAADVASKMANVYDRLSPKGPIQGNRVQIILHAPKARSEEDYRTIEVEPIRD